MRGALLVAFLLSACGSAARATTPAPTTPVAEAEAPSPPPTLLLTLGQLTLRSVEPAAASPAPPRELRPPMYAEMVNDAGGLTGTRCGATSLSADGVLRRDDEIVARLEATAEGLVVRDGAGRDALLVVREHRIESASGELRFRRDGSSIVSPDAEVPSVEITPVSANLDTALALFATLLVCNDLGP